MNNQEVSEQLLTAIIALEDIAIDLGNIRRQLSPTTPTRPLPTPRAPATSKTCGNADYDSLLQSINDELAKSKKALPSNMVRKTRQGHIILTRKIVDQMFPNAIVFPNTLWFKALQNEDFLINLSTKSGDATPIRMNNAGNFVIPSLLFDKWGLGVMEEYTFSPNGKTGQSVIFVPNRK